MKNDFEVIPQDDSGPVLAITDENNIPDGYEKIVLLDSALPFPNPAKKWIRHPYQQRSPDSIDGIDLNKYIEAIVSSWERVFSGLKEENGAETGLRPPQIGAVHAMLAHWSVSDQAATIVMPTGTGKTGTTLSILVANSCRACSCCGPNRCIKESKSGKKFLELGILKRVGVVLPTAFYPVVGILRHKPKQTADVDVLFEKCNIIVTTMSIAGNCSSEIQEKMAHWCSNLFIDEAHHIGAPTWNALNLNL